MKHAPALSSALGLTGLAALTIYILACTSFSPDDSKVLFPTYDPQAKEFGVGLYDRGAGKATMLFVPQQPPLEGGKGEAAWLRPQWLQDGRHILVGWAREAEDDRLDLAVLPFGHAAPIRVIHLAGLSGGASQLSLPLPTARGRLFLRGQSNVLVRVDLLTGEVESRVTAKVVAPYASPDGDRVNYVSEGEHAESEREFGLIDPETWQLQPMTRFKLELESDEGDFQAISPDGKWVVAADENSEGHVGVVLLQSGLAQRRVQVSRAGEELRLSGLVLSSVNQTAYAAYWRTAEGETNASFGVVEIPLTRGEPRRTPLVKRLENRDEERLFYCAPSVSHDGKTLACASTYMAAGDKLIDAGDCALFLVDLTDPARKVTRVPIPQPPLGID